MTTKNKITFEFRSLLRIFFSNPTHTHRKTQQEYKNNGVLSYQTAVYGLRVRRRQDEIDRVGGDRTIRGDGIVEFQDQYEKREGFEYVDYICLCSVVQG